ncbi:hypothetical protein SDJN02_22135, partial [Cucurbita argyrosperma subsp. argyrosperma]
MKKQRSFAYSVGSIGGKEEEEEEEEERERSPSLEIKQVEKKEENNGEEDGNGEYEGLIKLKLKCLRIKMRRGWSLRLTHQSKAINL